MNVAADTLILTKPLWEQFLNSLKINDRKTQTIRIYRKCMEELYDYLPDSKEITCDTLDEWRNHLKESGYSDSMINLRMTASNGLLKFCGMGDYATAHEHAGREDDMPEMTRKEYLHFLSIVRNIGTEQEYLLIKLFASADIRIQELQYLTVESCRDGAADLPDGRVCIIPPCLGQEMTDYACRRGILSGAVFVTRSGNPLDRSNIARSFRQLAKEAGMDPEKCSPAALHRVFRTTEKNLKKRLMPIYLQTYDIMLNTEQMFVSWQ